MIYNILCDIAHHGTVLLLLYGPFCIYLSIKTIYDNVEIIKDNDATTYNYYYMNFANISWFQYYFFLDACFYLYLQCVKYFGNIARKPLDYVNDTFPLQRRERVFQYLLNYVINHNVDEGQEWLSNWFLDKTRRITPSYSDLGKLNILDFFAYAFFRQKYIENLDNMQLKEITNYADIICSKLGKLTNQRNAKFFVMGHPFDSIIPMCQEAPLLYYVVFDFFIRYLLTEIMLIKMNYKCRNDIGPLKYFVKEPKNILRKEKNTLDIIDHTADEKKMYDDHYYNNDDDDNNNNNNNNEDDNIPLIFFHGLGAGLATYYLLFEYFINSKQFENRTIILIDMPYVSMEYPKFRLPAPTIAEMNLYIETIVRRECPCFKYKHKVTIDILAHSYGTFITANILYSKNNINTRHAILVDPVALQLFHASLCKKFLYARKINRKDLLDILSLHAMKDISITRTLMRHGDWFDGIIWLEDVLNHADSVHIFLAGKDKFLPIEGIHKSVHDIKKLHNFNDNQMSSCILPNTGHGTFFYLNDEIAYLKTLFEGNTLLRNNSEGILKRRKRHLKTKMY